MLYSVYIIFRSLNKQEERRMNNSYIEIEGLEVYAYHGVFENERRNGQNFYISAKLFSDFSKSANSDNLSDSTDYGEICHFITKLMNKKTFNLIESAAGYVATELLLNFTDIERIDLKLSKPKAPVGLPFENISINISKKWHYVYIALGSNIGDKQKYLKDAVDAIKSDTMCDVISTSDFITTAPYGYTEQDDFLNGVIKIKTLYSPEELLEFLHSLENKAGRTRDIHWGPRTLDLDILFYDDLVTSEPGLTIPHPEIEKRSFVLEPLRQIEPYLVHPITHKRICDIKISE